jgi:hypothetical protein
VTEHDGKGPRRHDDCREEVESGEKVNRYPHVSLTPSPFNATLTLLDFGLS